MPKERRSKIPHPSPYQHGSSSRIQTRPIISQKDKKGWDDARCPICMDHPHNAILLQCTSKQNGCKPYMCNTSYRHSNCLDQFNKSNNPNPNPSVNDCNIDEGDEKLCCPLCRGSVTGWIVEESARNYMNLKERSCSNEECEFNGNYEELRKHAREKHPHVRPSEVNPDRLRDWRRMERERDLGDLFSVLTEEDSLGERGERGERERYFAFPSFAIFLIVHVLGEGERERSNGGGNNGRGVRGLSSMRGPRRRRRVLWGESVSEFNDEFGYGNGNNNDDNGEGSFDDEEGES